MKKVNILEEMKPFVMDPVTEVMNQLHQSQGAENAALNKIGFSKQLKRAYVPTSVGNAKGTVYHINEIKKICLKYNFKFLKPELYQGPIHPLLGANIIKYEKQYDQRSKWSTNYMLLAPRESFKKVYDPDPILFYSLGEGYYEFVDKWGKDMTKSRLVKSFLCNFIFEDLKYGFENLQHMLFVIFATVALIMLALILIHFTFTHFLIPSLSGWLNAFIFGGCMELFIIYPLMNYSVRDTEFNKPDTKYTKD